MMRWVRRDEARRCGLATGFVVLAALGLAAGADARSGESQSFVELERPESEEDRLRTLDLETSKSTYLQLEFDVKRVSVGDPEVVDVNVLSPSEIQLVPERVGSTNLVLWDERGDPALLVNANVGSNFSQIEHRIRSVLGVEDVHVEGAGQSVVLKGSVPSPVHVDRAVAIAQAFFPERGAERVVNTLEVGGNQQVMIEVIVAEMERTLGRNMSVNWSSLVESGGDVFALQSFLGGLTAIDERTSTLFPPDVSTEFDFTDRIDLAGTFIKEGDLLLDLFIEAAHERGLARVLAKPTLLARSGQTASFLAGGEVPIPIAQGGAFGSITIEFKQFGVGVEFAPTVLGRDRIHLEVAPEVSEPDFTIGTQSGGFVTPGFVTRRASTSVELADGQSFAIAGLLQDNVRESVDKYPLLGSIPILGALFRSVQYQRNETELVIIVTPRLVQPLDRDEVRLPTDSYVDPTDFELYLLGVLEGQREGASGSQSGVSGIMGPAGHRLPVAMEETER